MRRGFESPRLVRPKPRSRRYIRKSSGPSELPLDVRGKQDNKTAIL